MAGGHRRWTRSERDAERANGFRPERGHVAVNWDLPAGLGDLGYDSSLPPGMVNRLAAEVEDRRLRRDRL